MVYDFDDINWKYFFSTNSKDARREKCSRECIHLKEKVGLSEESPNSQPVTYQRSSKESSSHVVTKNDSDNTNTHLH